MIPSRMLIRLAALCAIATAFTTFFLWLLPRLYTAPETFEASIALAENSYYMARLWVNFVHIPLALIAYFGMVAMLMAHDPFKITLGYVWFLIWGLVEMVGVSILIFSVNGTWRASYAVSDLSTKAELRQNIELFSSLWDSMFFVLLVAFLLGTAFFGWATWKGKGLEKILSYLFWMAVPLTLCIILSGYFDQTWAGPLVTWLYPLLQPISRFSMGIVLWKSNKTKHWASSQ